MRKLLDWIAAKLGYVRRDWNDLPRVRNGSDAVARGVRWEQFYVEEGGLADMLRAMRFELFEDWGNASDHTARDRMAIKDEAIRDLGRRVQMVIETGKIAAKKAA